MLSIKVWVVLDLTIKPKVNQKAVWKHEKAEKSTKKCRRKTIPEMHVIEKFYCLVFFSSESYIKFSIKHFVVFIIAHKFSVSTRIKLVTGMKSMIGPEQCFSKFNVHLCHQDLVKK